MRQPHLKPTQSFVTQNSVNFRKFTLSSCSTDHCQRRTKMKNWKKQWDRHRNSSATGKENHCCLSKNSGQTTFVHDKHIPWKFYIEQFSVCTWIFALNFWAYHQGSYPQIWWTLTKVLLLHVPWIDYSAPISILPLNQWCVQKTQRSGFFTARQNKMRKPNWFVALWCLQKNTLSFAGAQLRVLLCELLTSIYVLFRRMSWLQTFRVLTWKTFLIQSYIQVNHTNQPRMRIDK